MEFVFARDWYQLLLIALACYAIGCVNFARIISRKRHKDITQIGSGNPGTMNMTREFGLKVGVLTFFCDALKGGVPAIIGFFLYRGYVFAGTNVAVSDFIRYFCGVFVILGHIFPVTMRFKGGKGIASTLGLFWFCLACENGWWLLFGFIGLCVVVAYIAVSEWGSMGSLLGVTGFSIIQTIKFVLNYANTPVNAYLVCLYMMILLLNILTWSAHWLNLRRLFSGEEHHTSIKKLSKKLKKEKE